jgi:hypothetical protein
MNLLRRGDPRGQLSCCRASGLYCIHPAALVKAFSPFLAKFLRTLPPDKVRLNLQLAGAYTRTGGDRTREVAFSPDFPHCPASVSNSRF